MILLTDDEIDAAWARSPQNNLRDYAKEIEAAVIRKLATVSMEPVGYRSRLGSGSYTYCRTPEFFDNAEPLYTTEALAAARVQAIEEAAKICECQWSTLEERDAGIEFAEAIRALIGGKDGSAN